MSFIKLGKEESDHNVSPLLFLAEKDSGEMKELSIAGGGGRAFLGLLLWIGIWARNCGELWGLHPCSLLRGQIQLR